jgi:hypothetical protein
MIVSETVPSLSVRLTVSKPSSLPCCCLSVLVLSLLGNGLRTGEVRGCGCVVNP